MDFSKLSPTEFEDLVAKTFRRLGFRTTMTQKTGDGGVDVEARYDGEIFKGTYLIQCKHWKQNVGEPPLRDLYGVVQDRNALKGIMVSSSDFSKKAKEFADQKNIDLINGDTLRKLCSVKDIDELNQTPVYSEDVRGFTEHPNFDKELYDALTKMINENPKIQDTYRSLLKLLLTSVWEMGYESIQNGCINEAMHYCEQYLERFGKQKTNASRGERVGVEYVLVVLNLIKGDFIQTYQFLGSLEKGHGFNDNPHNSHSPKQLPPWIYKTLKGLYHSLLSFLDIKNIDDSKYYDEQEILFPKAFQYVEVDIVLKSIRIEHEKTNFRELNEKFKIHQVSNLEEQKNILKHIYSEELYKAQKIWS